MTPEMWTEVYWLLGAGAAGGLVLGVAVWYGLKRLGPPEDL